MGNMWHNTYLYFLTRIAPDYLFRSAKEWAVLLGGTPVDCETDRELARLCAQYASAVGRGSPSARTWCSYLTWTGSVL